jgi:hypothetical protein
MERAGCIRPLVARLLPARGRDRDFFGEAGSWVARRERPSGHIIHPIAIRKRRPGPGRGVIGRDARPGSTGLCRRRSPDGFWAFGCFAFTRAAENTGSRDSRPAWGGAQARASRFLSRRPRIQHRRGFRGRLLRNSWGVRRQKPGGGGERLDLRGPMQSPSYLWTGLSWTGSRSRGTHASRGPISPAARSPACPGGGGRARPRGRWTARPRRRRCAPRAPPRPRGCPVARPRGS